MMKLRKLAIVAAVVSASGLGMAGNAQAGSYGYSFNEIEDLTTNFTCFTTNDIGQPISFPCSGSPSFRFDTYQSSSMSYADLDSVPGIDGDTEIEALPGNYPVSGVANPDSTEAYQGDGARPGNNEFGPIGFVGNYAHGDAQTISQAINFPVDGTTNTHVINKAEGAITANKDDDAGADGTNTSATGFTVTFTSAGDFTVDFAFTATPFLESMITTLGATSLADLDVSATIKEINGNTVFSWTPNGEGDVTGGTVSMDEATLNIEISDSIVDANPEIYDPLNGIGGYDCSGGADANKCEYAAQTNRIAAGSYSLNLTIHEGIRLTNDEITTVPEPTSLVIMGIAMTGLGFARRYQGKKA